MGASHRRGQVTLLIDVIRWGTSQPLGSYGVLRGWQYPGIGMALLKETKRNFQQVRVQVEVEEEFLCSFSSQLPTDAVPWV
jgi:hypothetical protein